jgi:hypothetical protein
VISCLEEARHRHANEIAPEQLTDSIDFSLLRLEKVDVGSHSQRRLNDLKNHDHDDAQNRNGQQHLHEQVTGGGDRF